MSAQQGLARHPGGRSAGIPGPRNVGLPNGRERSLTVLGVSDSDFPLDGIA